MAITLNTAEIKARLSELISRVAFSHERLIVLRRGKPMAALISIPDLHRLEALDTAETNQSDQDVHPVMRAFGGWADREDLGELVTEIYANREAATEPEVEF
jgi:prevent-host-death family protein